jgi:hypothetical protein
MKSAWKELMQMIAPITYGVKKRILSSSWNILSLSFTVSSSYSYIETIKYLFVLVALNIVLFLLFIYLLFFLIVFSLVLIELVNEVVISLLLLVILFTPFLLIVLLLFRRFIFLLVF